MTTAGRKALRDALSQPLTDDEVRRKPDTCLVRARFMEPAAASAFLTDYARMAARRASELKSDPEPLAQHDAAVFAARSRSAAALSRMMATSRKRRT
jgi:hypothetical protein